MKMMITTILAVGLLLSSCAPRMQADFQSAGEQQGGSQPGAGQSPSIGTIERIKASIFHNQIEVVDVDSLFENDSLFVEGGGEGILELADRLRMRIFNTTRLGGITIEDEPGQPLFIRIYLELGGFTGEFASLDGETIYDTPGGAVIRIKGTHFLVVYDGDTRTTIAGNFDGSVTIESGGSGPLEIHPGMMRRAQAGSPPGPERPIPFNQVDYETRAREEQSPVDPLNVPGILVDLPQTVTPQPPPDQVVNEPPPGGPQDQNQGQPTTQAPPPPPGPPMAEILIGSHCRAGTSKVFESVRDFNAGVILPVDGRLADRSWWRVKVPDSRKSCWIYVEQIALSGDLDSVPVLAPPPTPTPRPTDTPTPTDPPTPTDTPYIPPDLPPPPPDLHSPENGTSVLCGPYYTKTVTLSWSEVSDADGIFAYEYELYHVGSGILKSAGAFYTTSIDVTVDCASDPGVEYRWRVRAIDGAMNEGDWSGDWYFKALGIG